MQLILMTGLPASGKSTFYKAQFADSHMRVNLDMLRTRNRERKLLAFCFDTQMPFAVDNTTVSREDRAAYIAQARERKYTVIGYYFSADLATCLERNAQRKGKARIPDVGLRAKAKQLEVPAPEEGYDQLFFVAEDGTVEQVYPT